jgi:hypothetical protein
MALALFAASPGTALAQTRPAPETFVNVSFGAQPLRRTLDATASIPLYDEAAKFAAAHRIGNGPFIDVSVGHRLMPSLIVGLAVTFFNSKGNAAGTASIPDPLFFEQPITFPIQGNDLKRSEKAVHLQAVWFYDVSQKMDIAISAGPSFFRASQEFLSGSVATGTQNATVSVDAEDGNGYGFNLGADAAYMMTPRYGAGVLLRYTYGRVSMPAAKVTAGGLQAGAGLRVRF